MNLAIIIGVSDYKLANSLPACKNDAKIIHDIISHSGKFDKTLYLSENTMSHDVKPAITKFITENADSEIGELFFYFSGHGLFLDGEFHYALTDADINKPKQTSLENSELDQLIRSLSPALTVKVVDACQSGVDYIKSAEQELEKFVRQKTKELNKCYFMLSSNSDQSSYASPFISFFTRYFVEAIALCNAEEIRYKEIMDYVSDSFKGNKKQTPMFIGQANFTEIFISVDEVLKENLKLSLDDNFKLMSELTSQPEKTLLDKIKEDARRYLDKGAAMTLLGDIEEEIQKNKKFSGGDFKDLFDIKHITDQYNSALPKLTQAAEWLTSSSDDFFAKPQWETRRVKKQVLKSGLNSIVTMSIMGMSPEYETREVDEDICTDIINTTELPFCNIISKAERLYPNINSSECIWLFFVSETKLAILTTFILFKTTDWEKEVALRQHAKWTSKVFELTNHDGIKDYISNTFTKFQDFSLEPIITRLNSEINREVQTSNPNPVKRSRSGKAS